MSIEPESPWMTVDEVATALGQCREWVRLRDGLLHPSITRTKTGRARRLYRRSIIELARESLEVVRAAHDATRRGAR